MRKLIVLLMVLGMINSVSAQEEAAKKPDYGWQKVMVGSINLTQTSFDNWAQGGVNSAAWQLNINFNFTNDQEKTNWANTGKFVFGQAKSGNSGYRNSIDEIKLESIFTYKQTRLINPYIGVTGETQFAPGYKYDPKVQISGFIDPAYIRESGGIGYKPGPAFKTRLGVALKQTITRDYNAPFADDPETTEIEKIKNEVGTEWVSDLNWKMAEKTVLASKLELFSTLAAFDEIDVNWDNTLTAKISEYINVNFNFKLFYDKDISKKRQIKQALALGLTYNFL